MVQVQGTAPLNPAVVPTPQTRRPATAALPAAAPAAEAAPVAQNQTTRRGTAPFDPSSQQYSVDRPAGPVTRNFFINGIRTPESSARSDQNLISQKLGQPVELVYNPTRGVMGDAIESVQNITGADTAISRQMQSRLRATLESGENIRVFAHSQGSAITGDALHKLAAQYRAEGKTPAQVQALMGRVEVVSFGGFADRESFPPGVKFTLRRDPNDHIPQLATAAQGIGRSYQEVAANPRSANGWARLAGSVGNGMLTVGRTVINNAGEAAGSALRNSGRLGNALLNDRVVRELERGDLNAASACVNKAELDAYCAQIGKDVTAQHLTRTVRDNRQSGYINDYFSEQRPT